MKLSLLTILCIFGSYSDFKNRVISKKLLIIGILDGIIIGFMENQILSTLMGGVIMAVPLYLIAYLYLLIKGKQGIGGGDIKIAFLYGLFLRSPVLIFYAYFMAFFIAGIFVLYKRIKGRGNTENILVPYMSIGVIISFCTLFLT